MGIQAVLNADAWSELDEGRQELYTEAKDGRYVLDADGVDDLPSVQGLVSTLNKYKEASSSAHGLKQKLERLEELDGYGELGLPPEEIRERLQRLDELEASGGDVDGKIEELREKYEARQEAQKAKLQQDIEKAQEEVAKRDAFIERLLIDNELERSLNEAEVIPQARKAVKALIKTEHEPQVVREGDEYRAIVPTELGDVSIEDFVGKWTKSEDADPFMPASGNNGTGSGTGTGSRGSAGKNPFAKDTRNITEQMRLMRENPDQARLLAQEAGVKLPKAS